MPELMDIFSKGELVVQTEGPFNVLTASWTTMENWDTVSLNRGPDVVADASANSITVNTAGPYSVSLFVNCAFDRTEELYIGFSVNGADPGKWLAEQGRGANRPIDFSWYGIHNLSAGDVITVVAQMETTDTEVTVLHSSFTIAKEF